MTYWDLVEESGQHHADLDDRAEWITMRLARLSLDEIVEFQLWLDGLHRQTDTWEMWGAATIIFGGFCSDDSFWYFQAWLIGLGRETFERVVANPDALADVPQVRGLLGRSAEEWSDGEFPEWEMLNYAALDAYEQVSGDDEGLDNDLEARGHERLLDPEPDGEPGDHTPAALASRYPRLSSLP